MKKLTRFVPLFAAIRRLLRGVELFLDPCPPESDPWGPASPRSFNDRLFLR